MSYIQLMKPLILLVTFLSSLDLLGQNQLDSTIIFEHSKKNPLTSVRFTKLINYDSTKYGHGCPRYPGNTYYLDHTDTVRAIFEGRIIAIFKVVDVYAIMTEFGNYYITYSGLTMPTLCKGEYIQQNQSLGLLSYNGSHYEYFLELIISKDEKFVDPMDWLK